MIKFLRMKHKQLKQRGNVMFDTRKLKTFSWINVGNPDHEDFERLLNEYKIGIRLQGYNCSFPDC